MFYIVDEQQRKIGPYDLVTLIKKLRNGKLSAEALLQNIEDPFGDPIMAQHHPMLREVFEEVQALPEHEERAASPAMRSYSLVFLLKQGLENLLSSQSLLLYASGFVLVCAAPLSALIWAKIALPLKFTASIVCVIAGMLALSYCLIAHLRQHRGQPLDSGLILQTMKEHRISLLKMAALIGCIAAIGLWFIIIPGIFIITFTIFTPLLITDQKLSVANALVIGRKRMQHIGWDNIGVIFGLITINVVLAPLVLPLVFTLPMTLTGLITIYDEQMFA